MRKRLLKLASMVLMVGLVVSSVSVAATTGSNRAASTTYYVSVTGNDGNSGSQGSPFRTIQKAADVMQPGDTCIIRGGVYREGVKPKRSGVSGKPITFKAMEGEKVVISGADPVSGWEALPTSPAFAWASGRSIYRAPIGNQLAQTTYRKQDGTTGTRRLALDVYVEGADGLGQQMNQARFPNMVADKVYDKLEKRNYGALTAGGMTFAEFNAGSKPNDYWKDAIIHYTGSHVRWTAQTSVITGSRNNRVTFDKPLAKEWHRIAARHSKFYIYNKLEELDMATEWHYEDGYLYFWAPGGADMTGAGAPKVSIKQRKWAFDLAGKDYVHVNGLNIIGATVNLENATHNVIDGCNFKYVSSDPWVDYTYNRGGFGDHGLLSPWWDSTWPDVGVYIGGSNNVLKNSVVDGSFGDGVTVTGERNTVKNNIIRNANSNATEAGVLSVIGKNHDILANTMYNGGRSVLQFNFIEACRIMYNDMYYSGKLTKDLGVAYCYITDGKGTEMAYNWVHDNIADGLGAGIYLDNGSSNFILHHNVTWNAETMEGILLNSPAVNHKVYNNTLVNVHGSSGSAVGIRSPMEKVEVINNLSTNKPITNGNVIKNNHRSENPLFAGALFDDLNASGGRIYDLVKASKNLSGDVFALEANSPAIGKGIAIEGITDNVTDGSPDVGAYEYGQPIWVAGSTADVSHLGANTKEIVYSDVRRYNNTAPELMFNNKWYYNPFHSGTAYFFQDRMIAGAQTARNSHNDSRHIDVGDDIGAALTFRFSANQIKVIGSQGPDFGKVSITLTNLTDNKLVDAVVVDGYDATYKRVHETYSRAGLDDQKTYEFKLVTIAEKNPNAVGHRHEVDEIRTYKVDNDITITNTPDATKNLAQESKDVLFVNDNRSNAARVMVDGITKFKDIATGSTDIGAVGFAESYTGGSKDLDYWGVDFGKHVTLDKVVYTSGPTFFDGGWFVDDSLKVQVRQFNDWVDAEVTEMTPAYPYNNTAGPRLAGQTELQGIAYTFKLRDTWGDAVRIIGKPYAHSNGVAFTAIAELAAYYVEDDGTNTGRPTKPTSLTISGSNQVSVNGTLQLTVGGTPQNATLKGLIWETSDAHKAVVDETGLVRGRSLGMATITVRTADGEIRASHDVSVVPVAISNVKGNENLARKSGATLLSSGDQFANALAKMTDGSKELANRNYATSLDDKDLGRAFEFWGLAFNTHYGFNEVVYTTGPMFFDGGWFIDNSLKVQVRQSGQWVDVANMTMTPAYPYDNTAGPTDHTQGTSYTMKFDDTWGDAIRIYGKPYKHTNNFTFTSISEFEVYYKGNVALESLAINGPSTLKVNESADLQAVVTPANADTSALIWSSSDTSIGTVTNNGRVTVTTEGSLTITLQNKDGSLRADHVITVTKAIPPLANSKGAQNLASKQGLTLLSLGDQFSNALAKMTDGSKALANRNYGTSLNDDNHGRVEDYWGLAFTENHGFNKLVYTTGPMFFDGGWFVEDSLKVQVRQEGQWVDVTSLSLSPVYPYNNTAGPSEHTQGTSYTATFEDTWGDAIRIYGKPYKYTNNFTFTSISEFEVYYE